MKQFVMTITDNNNVLKTHISSKGFTILELLVFMKDIKLKLVKIEEKRRKEK